MSKKLKALLLIGFSATAIAKSPNPLCNGVQDSTFVTGDGSLSNPYLICNHLQFSQFAVDSPLSMDHYKLGVDLNFSDRVFPQIGRPGEPFEGGLDGDAHKLSSISFPESSTAMIAPIAELNNGRVENLIIDGVKSRSFGGRRHSGLVSIAHNSIISNVHIRNIDLHAPDFSGGMIGELSDSTLLNSSAQGVMRQMFGTDAGGGLVGIAKNASISACASHVKIENSGNVFGVSDVGTLIGLAADCRINDVYSDGDLIYTNIQNSPNNIGGLIGTLYSSYLTNAYYAGKIDLQGNVDNHGGLVGNVSAELPAYVSSSYWDKQVSGELTSAAGEGKTTKNMKTKSFWLKSGFKTQVWKLQNRQYPRLWIEGIS